MHISTPVSSLLDSCIGITGHTKDMFESVWSSESHTI